MDPVPADYDLDPARFKSIDPTWQQFGDVHGPVAARIAREGLEPVLDVGGGRGALGAALPAGWPVIVVDASMAQLVDAPPPKVRGDALRLPFPNECAGAVTMLWMLYHLGRPELALAEARRVLRPGGLLVACTSARSNDPELTDSYPPTPFDAEEAASVVSSVFSVVEEERWDAPMTLLPDRDAVLRYCRSHLLPSAAAGRVQPPVWLTKRGCLVYARR